MLNWMMPLVRLHIQVGCMQSFVVGGTQSVFCDGVRPRATRSGGTTAGALRVSGPLAARLCGTAGQGCWSGTLTGHDLQLYPQLYGAGDSALQ